MKAVSIFLLSLSLLFPLCIFASIDQKTYSDSLFFELPKNSSDLIVQVETDYDMVMMNNIWKDITKYVGFQKDEIKSNNSASQDFYFVQINEVKLICGVTYRLLVSYIDPSVGYKVQAYPFMVSTDKKFTFQLESQKVFRNYSSDFGFGYEDGLYVTITDPSSPYIINQEKYLDRNDRNIPYSILYFEAVNQNSKRFEFRDYDYLNQKGQFITLISNPDDDCMTRFDTLIYRDNLELPVPYDFELTYHRKPVATGFYVLNEDVLAYIDSNYWQIAWEYPETALKKVKNFQVEVFKYKNDSYHAKPVISYESYYDLNMIDSYILTSFTDTTSEMHYRFNTSRFDCGKYYFRVVAIDSLGENGQVMAVDSISIYKKSISPTSMSMWDESSVKYIIGKQGEPTFFGDLELHTIFSLNSEDENMANITKVENMVSHYGSSITDPEFPTYQPSVYEPSKKVFDQGFDKIYYNTAPFDNAACTYVTDTLYLQTGPELWWSKATVVDSFVQVTVFYKNATEHTFATVFSVFEDNKPSSFLVSSPFSGDSAIIFVPIRFSNSIKLNVCLNDYFNISKTHFIQNLNPNKTCFEEADFILRKGSYVEVYSDDYEFLGYELDSLTGGLTLEINSNFPIKHNPFYNQVKVTVKDLITNTSITLDNMRATQNENMYFANLSAGVFNITYWHNDTYCGVYQKTHFLHVKGDSLKCDLSIIKNLDANKVTVALASPEPSLNAKWIFNDSATYLGQSATHIHKDTGDIKLVYYVFDQFRTCANYDSLSYRVNSIKYGSGKLQIDLVQTIGKDVDSALVMIFFNDSTECPQLVKSYKMYPTENGTAIIDSLEFGEYLLLAVPYDYRYLPTFYLSTPKKEEAIVLKFYGDQTVQIPFVENDSSQIRELYLGEYSILVNMLIDSSQFVDFSGIDPLRPLPGVILTLKDSLNRTIWVSTSEIDGRFLFFNLRIGTYYLEATYFGCYPIFRQPIVINRNSLTTIFNLIFNQRLTDPTSNKSVQISNNPNLFPNPSADYFTVNFGNQHISNPRLEIFDSKMSLVSTCENMRTYQEINIIHFKTGLYIVKIYDGENLLSVNKLVKW